MASRKPAVVCITPKQSLSSVKLQSKLINQPIGYHSGVKTQFSVFLIVVYNCIYLAYALLNKYKVKNNLFFGLILQARKNVSDLKAALQVTSIKVKH